MNNAFREVPLTSRIGGGFNDNGNFGSAAPVLPVAVVDGSTGSPVAVHRSSSARPQLPWEQEPSLREKLIATITADDQTGAPLLLELDALERKIYAHLKQRQQEQALDLRAELAEIGAKGKAAVEKARATVEALHIAEGIYNSHLEEVTKSRKNLAAVKAETPNDEDFPEESEVAEHAAKLVTAQARHDAATAQSKRLDAAVKKARAEARQAEQALDVIRARRSELRAMLGGSNKRTSPIAGLGPVGLQG